MVVLCYSIVQSLETPVVLHLRVRLALCKQLHQAEAAITCCQHQGSPACGHKCSAEGMHAHTQVQSLDVGGHLPSLAICSIDISPIIDEGGSHTVVAFQCCQVQSCTAILVGGERKGEGEDRQGRVGISHLVPHDHTLTFSTASILASLSSNKVAASTLPSWAATWRGVQPRLSAMLVFPPQSSKCFRHTARPLSSICERSGGRAESVF